MSSHSSNASDSSLSGSSTTSSHSHKQRLSPNERIRCAIDILKAGRLSLLTALITVLDPLENDFSAIRDQFYAYTKGQPAGKLGKLLDVIHNHPRGHAQLESWMEPHAIELVTQKVHGEMDDIKDDLQAKIASITPQFLAEWDIKSTTGKMIEKRAPVLCKILSNAAQTERAKRNNTIKDCSTPCRIIITQLAKLRSNCSLYFAAPFSLFLWTNGVSRQTIEALARCGLCVSFTSLLTLLDQLATQCVDKAIQIAQQPHIMCYDNINISMSIFVEQRSSAPEKVQSGTFPILYEIQNATWEHMRLAPILRRAQQATDLTFNGDIRSTKEQARSMCHQARINVVNILLQGCASFIEYEHRAAISLRHQERRKLPRGHQTKQYPLRTSTIDESSVTGNIAVIDDVYINQLKMSHDQLSDKAIPSINDQSTNARIRGAKALRTEDLNAFTRIQCLQLGFGLFHLCMNLIWALLHVHRGSIDQPGTLSYFFAILDRSRLGCDHPDYHTLLATLMQILQGIILNAWKVECGYPSLAEFAASSPTPEQLCDIADRILNDHATPFPSLPKRRNNAQPDQASQAAESQSPNLASSDIPNQNLRILTRDLLYVLELTCATSAGDFGRIEDMLGNLAMVFRGAGSNNYCTEILHFLFNLRKVWTPEFADIMRDNMLVNFTGLEDHFMPVDLNIEHQIRLLKRFFTAKGVHASWDRLGEISATIDLLRSIQKQIGRSLGTAYKGITHITPDTSSSAWKIADKINELALHVFTPKRERCNRVKPVVDCMVTGEQKLKSSTLNTFNRKVRSMLAGEGIEAEVDDIPEAVFDLSLEADVGCD